MSVGGRNSVVWKGDNEADVRALLSQHETRMHRDGDNLLIQGAWSDLNTLIEPGDTLILEGDRLGILRAENAGPVH